MMILCSVLVFLYLYIGALFWLVWGHEGILPRLFILRWPYCIAKGAYEIWSEDRKKVGVL